MDEALFFMLGSKCAHCGFSDIRALHIDYVNGCANRESNRMEDTSMYGTYLKHMEFYRDKIQVLCANCKLKKLHELINQKTLSKKEKIAIEKEIERGDVL